MKKLLVAATAALSAMSSAAIGQTTVPLNTGYDYTTFSVYPAPTGTTSNVRDNYWIRIASYEPPTSSTTTMPIVPAYVISSGAWSTLPNSRWIGPRPQQVPNPTATHPDPAYSIFRKCFCLAQGYQTPLLSFQVRADNNIQVWLNYTTNTLVAAQAGNFNSGAALNSGPVAASMFRTGRNCLYVLLEDNGGGVGFTLAGTVTAFGLMPTAIAGIDASSTACQCGSGTPSTPTGGSNPGTGAATAGDDDVLRAIVSIAEARRATALARREEARGLAGDFGAQY